jgi:hypothetical protein
MITIAASWDDVMWLPKKFDSRRNLQEHKRGYPASEHRDEAAKKLFADAERHHLITVRRNFVLPF